MGSIANFKTANKKALSSRLSELESQFRVGGGEFRAYRIGDLFEIDTGSLVNADLLTEGHIKRISAKSDNNGVLGSFNTEKISEARHFENFISVNFFGNSFYHPYKASVEMKVHTLKLKERDLNTKIAIYLVSCLNQVLGNNRFGYGSQLSSSKLKEDDFYILLPYQNKQIAFSYMEKVIELLEAERLEELEAYLTATGLSNYTLSEENHKAMVNMEAVEWKAFKIIDLFSCIRQGERLTKSDQIKGSLPFVMSGVTDTGVANYIGNNVEIFPSNSLTIDIFGNVFYRNYQFGASDDVGIYWQDNKILDKNTMLFIATSLSVALTGKFSYGYKLRSSKSHHLTCVLPTDQNGNPNYSLMNDYMEAVHKLVIEDVVNFAEQRNQAYRQIVRQI